MTRSGSEQTAGGGALAGAVLLIAAIVYWVRILADPAGRIAGGNGDPLFVAYIVSWVAAHLGGPAVWHPPFFHPAAGVLAYSDHLFGLGAAAWPMVAAGLSPVLIVNVLAIVASLATSLALYAWLRDLRYTPAASAAAALVVTYSAWRHLQISHLQLQWLAFLPLALLCYGRAIDRRASALWIWLGGGALALQSLFTPSLGVLMMPLVGVWLIAASLLARRTTAGHWAALIGSIAIVGLVNLPIAVHYWRLGDALDRDPVEIALHSANWVDWISAQHHWLYGDALEFTQGGERELFAGIGFIAVAGLGVMTVLGARAPLAIAGVIAAVVALWASTGVSAEGPSLAHLPYEIFRRVVPGGGQVRVPARFVLLAAVFLAPAIAAGWAYVQQAIARRRPAWPAAAIVLLLATLVSAEALADVAWYERAADLTPRAVTAVDGGAMLRVPLAEAAGPRQEIRRMWEARLAGVPIVNGYSGHESPLYRRLRDLQAAPPDAAVQGGLYALLRRYGVSVIVADSAAPALIDPARLEEVAPSVFRIPDAVATARIDRFEMGRGAALVLTESGWSYPEHSDGESWVWSIRPRARLAIPLGGVPRRQITLRARSQSPRGDELELWAGGWRLGVQPLSTTPVPLVFRLPDAVPADGWIDLEIRGPRPIRLPGNPDPRALGVCVFEIVLE